MINKIKTIEGLRFGTGCDDAQILEAEKTLNVKFPNDYKEYLKEFGRITFYGTEWTGLNTKGYRNVIEATKDEKSYNKDFPDGYFVLENLGIDSKMAIVNEKGEVYVLQHEKKELICDSLEEYLDLCIARSK